MLTMKLVKKIGENFAIYEIPNNLKRKYHGKYILSQAEFSSYEVNHFSNEEVINNLKDYAYEGICETIKEAEMTAKYGDAMHCIDNLIAGCKMFHEEVKRFKKWQDEIIEE